MIYLLSDALETIIALHDQLVEEYFIEIKESWN